MTDRREFLKLSGLTFVGAAVPRILPAVAQAQPVDTRQADYTIEIAKRTC